MRNSKPAGLAIGVASGNVILDDGVGDEGGDDMDSVTIADSGGGMDESDSIIVADGVIVPLTVMNMTP